MAKVHPFLDLPNPVENYFSNSLSTSSGKLSLLKNGLAGSLSGHRRKACFQAKK
jgi:hypothetical protein